MTEGLQSIGPARNFDFTYRLFLHVLKGYPWLLDQRDEIKIALEEAKAGRTGYVRGVSSTGTAEAGIEKTMMFSLTQENSGFWLNQVPGIHEIWRKNSPEDFLEHYTQILRAGFRGVTQPNVFIREGGDFRNLPPVLDKTENDRYFLLLWTGFSEPVFMGNYGAAHDGKGGYGNVSFVSSTPPQSIGSVIILEPGLLPSRIDERVAFYKEKLKPAKPSNPVRIETDKHELVTTLSF